MKVAGSAARINVLTSCGHTSDVVLRVEKAGRRSYVCNGCYEAERLQVAK